MNTKLVKPTDIITISINAPVLPNETMKSWIVRDIEKAIGECTVNFYDERGYEFSILALDGNRSEREDIRAKAMNAYFNSLYQNKH